MKLEYTLINNIGFIIFINSFRRKRPQPLIVDIQQLADFFETPDMTALIITSKGRDFWQHTDPELMKIKTCSSCTVPSPITKSQSFFEHLAFAPIPVLAMIRGRCLGIGLEIALSCHFRFASETAMIGFPKPPQNVLSDWGRTVLSRDILPRQSTLDLLLSGRIINASEAFTMGLVNMTAKPSNLQEEAVRYLRNLTNEREPAQINAIMEAIHTGRLTGIEKALNQETRLFLNLAKNNLENLR